ncbi:uncharacterized protein LOC126661680 [Mercurialis annua]|uniref:uncharacterized protein LOC126661679 n=1 Tax=Mercurialis annua TaxID=3986 RepID=UPI00215FA789|nr:uncharacterized protein LOC126661679 [Mercurialis annua]XP_050211497.1 uncharacterized protein LOC126661680 [Mercurialis annua]
MRQTNIIDQKPQILTFLSSINRTLAHHPNLIISSTKFNNHGGKLILRQKGKQGYESLIWRLNYEVLMVILGREWFGHKQTHHIQGDSTLKRWTSIFVPEVCNI